MACADCGHMILVRPENRGFSNGSHPQSDPHIDRPTESPDNKRARVGVGGSGPADAVLDGTKMAVDELLDDEDMTRVDVGADRAQETVDSGGRRSRPEPEDEVEAALRALEKEALGQGDAPVEIDADDQPISGIGIVQIDEGEDPTCAVSLDELQEMAQLPDRAMARGDSDFEEVTQAPLDVSTLSSDEGATGVMEAPTGVADPLEIAEQTELLGEAEDYSPDLTQLSTDLAVPDVAEVQEEVPDSKTAFSVKTDMHASSLPVSSDFVEEENQTNVAAELVGDAGAALAEQGGVVPTPAVLSNVDSGEQARGPEQDFAAEAQIGNAFAQMFDPASDEVEPVATEEAAVIPESASGLFDDSSTGLDGIYTEQELLEVEAIWFVGINDEQVGPLSKIDIADQIRKGEVGAESLCWSGGMDDWSPLRTVDELKSLLVSASASEAPAGLGVAIPAPGEAGGHQPIAAGGFQVTEPSWRPGAAGALASLVAEEMSDAPKRKPRRASSIAEAPPLPAGGLADAPNALEKLLQGEEKKQAPAAAASSAQRFGAMEQSVSRVRALPKQGDVQSTLPLQDPTGRSDLEGKLKLAGVALLVIAVVFLLGIVLGGGDESSSSTDAPKELASAAEPAPKSAKPAVAAAPQGAGVAVAAPVAPVAPAEAKPVETVPAKKKASRSAKKKKRSATSKRSSERVRESRSSGGGGEDDDLLGIASSRKRIVRKKRSSGLPSKPSDEQILGTIRSHKRDVTKCLRSQRQTGSPLEGRMTTRFLIRPSGRTKSVRVAPARFQDSVVADCMISSVKRWKFPRFSGRAHPTEFPITVRAQ